MSKIWWIVKVYDYQSGTTTNVSTYAVNKSEAQENVEADGWEFVSAYSEEDEE